MCVYGLKGGCAYMYHSEGIRNSIKDKDVYGEGPRTEVFKELFAITAGLTDPNPTLEGLLGLNMGVGKSNFTVMDFLDKGHNLAFGKPTPSPVNRAPVEGKCILVSGHDMVVLKNLLDQTKDKGVNIYTHGEMLPAFGYPELKKYDHLVGNFGGAWFNQTNEFPDFPGAILLNSNCLIQPQPSYAKRLFTTHIVGWDDIKHIEGNDYSELIECALKQPGFKKGTRQFKKYENVESEMTGYGHATMAEMLVPEIKAGNLTEIYLVGGCDNLDPTRQKYLEVMLNLPPTAIVLTLGCAKFRLFGHKEQMGYLPGGNKVPRLIDVGQCNDSYSAVKVALALTEILGVGVNELPLHLVLSWVEQKAVVILLTLLHLGIKNINIGPNLPVFLTPTLVNYLVQNFALQPMSMPKQIKSLLKFQSRQQEERPMEMFANLQDFMPCKFAAKKEIAVNTFQMTFEFMNKESVYSLKAGQHIIFRAKNNEGDFVSRAYTPISSPGSKGSFDIIVKVYQEGLFSNFLKNMESGDLIEVQGPCGSTLYEEKQGKICLKSDLQQFSDVKSINMVTGGTSCVSMYQIIQEIVEKKQTNIKANVIVANSKANLKVLEKEFMALKEKDSAISKNINIVYICSDKEGRISKQLFEKHFAPAASDKNVVNLVAGPVNFRQAACSIFQELNYPESNLVKFY